VRRGRRLCGYIVWRCGQEGPIINFYNIKISITISTVLRRSQYIAFEHITTHVNTCWDEIGGVERVYLGVGLHIQTKYCRKSKCIICHAHMAPNRHSLTYYLQSIWNPTTCGVLPQSAAVGWRIWTIISGNLKSCAKESLRVTLSCWSYFRHQNRC
jgi:hypothetical protein